MMRGRERDGVLVTGANGFVGSHLCEMLGNRGWRVRAVRRAPGRDPEEQALVLQLSSDPSGWQRALGSVASVVHLAAHVHRFGDAQRSVAAFDQVNVEGSRFVAEQAVRAGVGRFIYVSSIKVNGEGRETPYRPDDIPAPRDPYGESKWKAELALREVCADGAMELVVIRPPLVYGPGVRANFRRLMNLARLGIPLPFASIDNRRSLVSVWNLADFIQTCLSHPKAPGRTFLIADSEDLSTPELFRRISRSMKRTGRLFPFPPRVMLGFARMAGLEAEVRRLCESLTVDCTQARTLLGWRPVVEVDDAVARTVAAYGSEPGR